MLVIGFFGVGKTTLAVNDAKMADLTDLGSPSLSLLQDTVAKYDVVFADPTWEHIVLQSGLPFIVVVPSLDRKEEFLLNYSNRYKNGTGGGGKGFRKLIGDNWDFLIGHLQSLKSQATIVLEKGEFLSDVPLLDIYENLFCSK